MAVGPMIEITYLQTMRLGPAGGLDGARTIDHVCRGAWLRDAHPGWDRWRL